MPPFVEWLYANYPRGMPDDFPECIPEFLDLDELIPPGKAV